MVTDTFSSLVYITSLSIVFSVDSLCLDSPGWEDRSKHPFDVIMEVLNICI
jgi:hypothetical protein